MMKALGVEACGAGYHFDTTFGGCVADTAPPASKPFDYKILIYGLGVVLLLGAFMGGRASKSSGVTSGTRKRVTKSFWVTF